MISVAISRRAKKLPHYRFTTSYNVDSGQAERIRVDLPLLKATVLPFHEHTLAGVDRRGNQEGERNEELLILWCFKEVKNNDIVEYEGQCFEVKRFKKRENFWRAEITFVSNPGNI